MEGARLTRKRNRVRKDREEESAVNRLRGDVIWIKLNNCSWWPGQVVDENTVSEGRKSKNRSEGEVLVRVYGSYNYLYVDPMKHRSEFENILKQNNGNHWEIFQKALEHDLSQIKSGRLKRRASEPREKARVRVSRNKLSKQDGIKKRKEIEGPDSAPSASGSKPRSVSTPRTQVKRDNPILQKAKKEAERATPKHNGVLKKLMPDGPVSVITTSKKSQDLSARRIKVMQNLGLIAPCGSPFHRRELV